MDTITQMTEQTLNALKGWPQQAAVDFTAPFDSSITDVVPPGSVVHLSSTLTFLLGVGNSNVMPLFTFQGSQDADVNPPAPDPTTKKGAWVPVNPTGECMALVAVGAYELVSTQYDTAQAASYVPNTPLTSPTTTSNAGKLVPGILGTNMIVGFVSRGIVDNGYGFNAVAFWPEPAFVY